MDPWIASLVSASEFWGKALHPEEKQSAESPDKFDDLIREAHNFPSVSLLDDGLPQISREPRNEQDLTREFEDQITEECYKQGWTSEEKILFFDLYQKYGKSCKDILSHLSSQTPLSLTAKSPTEPEKHKRFEALIEHRDFLLEMLIEARAALRDLTK